MRKEFIIEIKGCEALTSLSSHISIIIYIILLYNILCYI